MKKIIISTAFILLVCTASFGKKVIAKGNTFSALGDYKIETVDNPFSLRGKDCSAYKISYENSSIDVTLVVCKEEKCKRYLVLSDKLSVQYVCNPYYFGVERLDKTFEKEGYKTSDANLNKIEYFHQKVLGPGQQQEVDAVRLVAAYFPFLLNSNEEMTAVR
jgi:hypothetical protein